MSALLESLLDPRRRADATRNDGALWLPLAVPPHEILGAAEIGTRMLESGDLFITGGYRSTHARSKTFASAELAEQFDYGVRSFKWGQDRPATAAQRAGWDWAELMDEKGRARFERFGSDE